MLNGLDPEQDLHSVCPDLGPKCLQRLSADDKIPASKALVLLIMFTNSLDPDQARQNDRPDLDPNC